jgi:hypothetical protein
VITDNGSEFLSQGFERVVHGRRAERRWPRRSRSRLWKVTAPGLERTSGRCQVLCVGTFLDDRDLGGRVVLAWNLLSQACHHRVYEVAPTATELNRSLETAWELADACEVVCRRIQR